MRSPLKIAVYVFATVGLLFTIAAVVIGVGLWNELHGEDRRNNAQASDVEHFFHWSSIPEPTKLKIIGSYLSRRSPGGDHLDAVCINLNELPYTPEWKEIGVLERSFQEAVGMALNWASAEVPCIPDFDTAKRAKLKVLVESVKFARGSPQSVFIALIDRERNIVYFVSFKV